MATPHSLSAAPEEDDDASALACLDQEQPSPSSRPCTLSSLADDTHPSHPSMDDSLLSTTSRPSTHQTTTAYGAIVVPSIKPMMFSPVTFIATSRSTHSDVMSTCNTTRLVRVVTKPGAVRARLPYAETAAFKSLPKGIDVKHMTPVEKQQEAKVRARVNRELHEEHSLFMARLRKERQERTRIESAGAIVIQKYSRGFLVRPRTDYVKDLQTSRATARLMQNTHKAITEDLLDTIEMVGLKPIPGLTLNSRKMIAMQLAKEEEDERAREELASVQIQAIFRARAGKKRMSIIRTKHDHDIKEKSAIKIQAVARGFKGRRRVKAMIQKEKEEAITRIQARIRLKRGRLESTQMKKRMQREKREAEAAVTVQKQFRGKLSRRKYGITTSFNTRSSLKVQKMYRTMEKLDMDYVTLDEEDENPDHDAHRDYEFRRTQTLTSYENKPITPLASLRKSQTNKTFSHGGRNPP